MQAYEQENDVESAAAIFLIVSALFCLATTIVAMVDPTKFGQRLGLRPQGADGHNEFRAQYAGFFLAVAVVDVLSIAAVLSIRIGLIANAMVFGGLFFGRLVSLVVDRKLGPYGSLVFALFFIDGIGFGLSMLLSVLSRSL